MKGIMKKAVFLAAAGMTALVVGHQGKPCGVKEYHSAGSDPGCHGETDEGRA